MMQLSNQKKGFQPKIPEKKSNWAFNLMWWVIFPPYALYRLIRNPNIHWILKSVISLLFVLVTMTIVDSVLNPQRVENNVATKTITQYMSKHETYEKINNIERVGYGYFLNEKNETQKMAVYRVMTDSDIGFATLYSPKGNTLVVDSFEKQFPYDGQYDSKTISPMVAVWLADHLNNQEKLKKMINTVDTEKGIKQTVQTNQHTYTFLYKNSILLEVIDEKEHQYNMSTFAGHQMASRLYEHIQKNKDTYGKMKAIQDIDYVQGVRTTYFSTSNGDYKSIEEKDGSIQILKVKY